MGGSYGLDGYDENWAAMRQISQDELVARVDEFYEGHEQFYRTLPPDPLAQWVTKILASKVEQFCLTSRASITEDDTRWWINQYYPDRFSSVNFLGAYDEINDHSHQKTKGAMALALGATHGLDDQPKHVNSYIENGQVGILFGTMPWSDPRKVSQEALIMPTLNDVLEYFSDFDNNRAEN
jgi:hypothetical protein